MGYGTDLGNITALEGRAKRKLITQTMALYLIQIARGDEDWIWEQRFSNTFLCQNELKTAGGRSYTIYCKNRCCHICLAIRKAEKVNLYLPTLEAMPNPQFLTLTAQSVSKDGLRQRVLDTAHAMRTIIARHKKRNQRGRGERFSGIWSLESNFNGIAKTYNPHIHVITATEYQAETIMNDWIQYWKDRNVYIVREAQYYRPAKGDLEKDLIETVKYGSKIFTEPDIAKRIKFGLPKKPSFIYVRALYNILQAMEGIDIFNTYGIELKDTIKRPKKSTILKEYEDWNYDLATPDWINEDLGLRLAKYKVPDELEALLSSRVNNDLE